MRGGGVLLGAGLFGIVAGSDYRKWRRLGDGGVPANPVGYVIVTVLRAFKREPFSTSPYDTSTADAFNGSWLTALSPRRGGRPDVDPHPIPQRQVGQYGTSELLAQTLELFDATVAAHPGLILAPSGFETRHDAITVAAPDPAHTVARRARGEVAHVHPGDGSMHMIFSVSDAAQVLDAGWGERHGLAGRGRLPLTYLLIYAPRDGAELAVVQRLLEAAIGYLSQGSST